MGRNSSPVPRHLGNQEYGRVACSGRVCLSRASSHHRDRKTIVCVSLLCRWVSLASDTLWESTAVKECWWKPPRLVSMRTSNWSNWELKKCLQKLVLLHQSWICLETQLSIFFLFDFSPLQSYVYGCLSFSTSFSHLYIILPSLLILSGTFDVVAMVGGLQPDLVPLSVLRELCHVTKPGNQLQLSPGFVLLYLWTLTFF